MPRIYFIGVDVGTSSARAALVTSDGKVLKQAVRQIKIWNPEQDHFEQSSDDIWSSVCDCVVEVSRGVAKEEIVAISFDATCSLVVLGADGIPLSISNTRNSEQNVILWMDHRAKEEAQQVNATQHELLQYVGGRISLEMQMPKLMWLKKNAFLSTWTKIWRTFDLPDFLTWRSTNCDTRSLCSVACKWNYDAVANRWSSEFLNAIGLEELTRNNFEIIGSKVDLPGSSVGNGLTQEAAEAMNLLPGTIVGTSLIDAHAGALGMLGCRPSLESTNSFPGLGSEDIEGKLALICGTSTCHMGLSKEPCSAWGVWGPYRSVIIPGLYLNEGGQSAAGILLDHIIKTHPQYMNIKMNLKDDEHVYSYLNNLLDKMAKDRNLIDPCYLTEDIHVWPDFHGNRSPIADPNLMGMISGLSLNVDEENLAILYLASVQALAYGTRHIIENLMKYNRPKFTSLLMCGGLRRNSLYIQTHADVCNLPVILPNEQEMVLVGSAMLGACAAKVYSSLQEAAFAMGGEGELSVPNQKAFDFHNRKYRVFLEMFKDQQKYRNLMKSLD